MALAHSLAIRSGAQRAAAQPIRTSIKSHFFFAQQNRPR
jgi:hypothetical protein